jgi:AcrR family transcriptional regulator
MQTSEAPSGLRERKREETRARMEKAAVEIALRDGVEHATVDAISAAANVSSRTFFNYFESKEDAILGVPEVSVLTDAIMAHAADYRGEDVVDAVLGLLFSVVGPNLPDSGIQRSRMKLVAKNPQLLTRQVTIVTRMSAQLIAAIEALMAANPRFSHQSTDDRSAAAEIVLALCAGAFRVAVKEWMVAGGHDSTELIKRRAAFLITSTQERLK